MFPCRAWQPLQLELARARPVALAPCRPDSRRFPRRRPRPGRRRAARALGPRRVGSRVRRPPLACYEPARAERGSRAAAVEPATPRPPPSAPLASTSSGSPHLQTRLRRTPGWRIRGISYVDVLLERRPADREDGWETIRDRARPSVMHPGWCSSRSFDATRLETRECPDAGPLAAPRHSPSISHPCPHVHVPPLKRGCS
jgi:hypothetical protein